MFEFFTKKIPPPSPNLLTKTHQLAKAPPTYVCCQRALYEVLGERGSQKNLYSRKSRRWLLKTYAERKNTYSVTKKDAGLKVHKIEIFFGFDFEICIISFLVM